jgi:MinD-like ATPase involved in chromosome partitioning or flagellar assembly
MTDDIDVIVCAAGAAWELPLLRAFQRPEIGIRVLRRCVESGELLGTALRDRPRAVLVDAGLTWVDRDLVTSLRRAGVEVVAIGPLGRRGAELGIVGLEADVTAEDLARSLDRLGPAIAEDGAPAVGEPGRLLAVWGATGAPGRTTVAVHAAIESARNGRRTLLVDGDGWGACVAQLLELPESPSVAQAARLAADGWPAPLADCVQAGPDGLDVLVGLPRAELWPEVGAEAWRAVLAAATQAYEVVVVDVAAPIEEDEELVVDRIPFRRNVMTTATLDRADVVLLVAGADPVGLRRGVIAHRMLTERATPTPPVAVVLNRTPRSARRAQDCSRAVESWIGAPPAAFLPADANFARVVWEGRSLHAVAPRSAWLRELRDLLAAVDA